MQRRRLTLTCARLGYFTCDSFSTSTRLLHMLQPSLPYVVDSSSFPQAAKRCSRALKIPAWWEKGSRRTSSRRPPCCRAQWGFAFFPTPPPTPTVFQNAGNWCQSSAVSSPTHACISDASTCSCHTLQLILHQQPPTPHPTSRRPAVTQLASQSALCAHQRATQSFSFLLLRRRSLCLLHSDASDDKKRKKTTNKLRHLLL